MVKRLKNKNQLKVAQTAFHRVFRSSDPFNEPFQPVVENRLILYPVEYQLDRNHFVALELAANVTGESEAYLSLIEGATWGATKERDHWQIQLGSYPYEELRHNNGWFPLMENAIYSTTGLWGIVISHEWHAVLGGSKRFIEAYKANLPGAENEVFDFLTLWKDNKERLGSNTDWLPKLLAHVYGQDEAHNLLVKAGMGEGLGLGTGAWVE